jgi:sarcosine oxidase subunit gamma
MAKAAPAKTAPSAVAARDAALAGQKFSASGVTLAVLPPAERISLRAPAGSVAALSKALGVDLPRKPKSSATKAGRTALWLGPDEWLIIDEAGKDPLADCAAVKVLHSAVGIAHRNIGVAVTGPAAAAAINAGCPQDLSLTSFPVGACSRTILGKIEIVLLRTAKDSFRVECWRSFSDYAWAFLTEGARDAAA